MSDDRPNVLFIVTDQFRGDCIGADPHCPTDQYGDPLLRTPNLNGIARNGALFSNAYTPAPKCIPARKCLWSGQKPPSAKATLDHNDEWVFEHPLPRVLRDAGYQTHLSGKLHSQPPGNRIGFEETDLHTASGRVVEAGRDDYANWLDRQIGGISEEDGHGLSFGGGTAGRPWHLDEPLHPTNWTTDRALEFLDQRDPTRPFFLTVSYVRPHTPFDPPQAYWDQFIDQELPQPANGDWTSESNYGGGPRGREYVHRARAAYYGLIAHLDQQLDRLFGKIDTSNLLVVMTADHGEMLGDHGRFTKMCPLEGATRVPMLLGLPGESEREPVGTVDRPVGLEDVMPTILDATGMDVPDTVEGRSLLDLIDDSDRADWRTAYHGEWGPHYNVDNAAQYLVDGEQKYIWNPVTGEELLFDLERDPHEETNRLDDPAYSDDLERWRSALTDRLTDRLEGLVVDGELSTSEPEAWEARF